MTLSLFAAEATEPSARSDTSKTMKPELAIAILLFTCLSLVETGAQSGNIRLTVSRPLV
jgi:hypothetical protein